MKKTTHTPTRIALAIASLTAIALPVAQAADWYMIDTQVGDNNWNSVSSSAAFKHWADSPSLPGYTGYEDRYATQMYANDTYQVDAGKLLRTVGGSGPDDVFLGGPLILNGAEFGQRSTGARRAIVDHVTSMNGTVFRSLQATIQHLNINTLVIDTGTTGFTSTSGRGFNLTVSNLEGPGNITFGNQGTYNLNIANTALFSGNMTLLGQGTDAGTTLGFIDSLSLNGHLTLQQGSFVNLTQPVTVGGLTIGDSTISPGVYDYAYLNANYGSIFTAGDSSGSINIIPEPSAVALMLGALTLAFATLLRRTRRIVSTPLS